MTPTTLQEIQAELAQMAAKVESLNPEDAVHQAMNDLLDRYQPLVVRAVSNGDVLAELMQKLDAAATEATSIINEVQTLNDEIRASLPVLAAAIVATPETADVSAE